MTSSKFSGVLAAGVASASLLAGPAFAKPELPPCRGDQVTLTIKTDTTSGWKVNGVAAAPASDSAWTGVSPAAWIGPPSGGGTTFTYSITFATPFPHGAMSVQAKWAADNCGKSLKAGSGAAVLTGPCFAAASPMGKDYLSFTHVTSAQFAPSDSSAGSATLTFTTTNMMGTVTGFAGVFTVTASCRRS